MACSPHVTGNSERPSDPGRRSYLWNQAMAAPIAANIVPTPNRAVPAGRVETRFLPDRRSEHGPDTEADKCALCHTAAGLREVRRELRTSPEGLDRESDGFRGDG